METRRFDKKDVKEVAELLKNGQVVAFPTDTVFGLGVISVSYTHLTLPTILRV